MWGGPLESSPTRPRPPSKMGRGHAGPRPPFIRPAGAPPYMATPPTTPPSPPIGPRRVTSARGARAGGVGRLPWQPRGGGAAAPHAPHARTYARASSRSVPARHARPRPFRFCAPLRPSPERQPPPRGSRTNPPKKGTEIRPTGTNCNGNRNRSPPGSLGTWPRGGGGRASTPRLR